MKMRFYSAMLVISSIGVQAFAKSPEAPTRPETEFKVLPAQTQEFFQFDNATPPSAFAPVIPSSAFRAPRSEFREPVAARLTIDFQKWGLAREVFAMAETFGHDRHWSEAERWYAGVCRLWPRSPYAALAVERQEAMAMLRLLYEAGEEQSEEPPLARPEKLKVLPREVCK